MSKVIQFPVPVRETVVVKLYSGFFPEQYALVIIDPEIGELQPPKYITKVRVQEMIAALSDDAKARQLEFEVHDFSSKKTLLLGDNDNLA